MHRTIILESCVESKTEAISAQKNGAHQLEICSRLDLEGLTPKVETVRDIRLSVNLPCKVMIRCREGSFYYSQDEINTMVGEIHTFKAFKLDGFVFGALTKDEGNTIKPDINAINQICKAAFPQSVTIHKAIDLCHDILLSIELLKEITNVKFILSSGGAQNAVSGAEMLVRMQLKAGKNISVIAAGSINPSNLYTLVESTGLNYFHGRRIV
jgi:copper homeostasis protein